MARRIGSWAVLVSLALAGCEPAGEDASFEASTGALVEPSSGSRRGATLAIGGGHACAIDAHGTVSCWGRNNYGQLGDGTTVHRSTPVTVSGLVGAVSLSAGENHTCALLAGGTVRCWGANHAGQLGDDTTTTRTTPVTVVGLNYVQDLSLGSYHSCAVRAQGTAHCWGDNSYGQLGNGTFTDARTPVTVSTVTDWKQISGGGTHTCGLRATGSVYCFGRGSEGQLGTGSTITRTTPFAAALMSDMRQVVTGAAHTCSLFDDGRVFCWGANGYGQIGDGTTTNRLSARVVPGLSSVGLLAAGGHDTCAARTVGGALRCWGKNDAGQVGTGSATPSSVLAPTTVVGVDRVTELAVGASEGNNYAATSCAVRGGGDVRCWGFGIYGQMGNGTTSWTNLSPVTPALDTVRATVSLSTQGKTMVIRPDGTNRAWQWMPGGTPAPTGPMFTTPRLVSTTAIHACVVLTDGTVQCWGDNEWGQLGDGTFTDRANPVDVSGLLEFEAVHLDTADLTSCAVLTDGGVRCWGAGEKLGDGGELSWARKQPTPAVVLGLEDAAVQVGVAGESACALLVDGRVSCWGAGYGYDGGTGLGFGGSTGSPGDPGKLVADLTAPLAAPAIAIASGVRYSGDDGHCALLATGQVQCWGHYPGNGGDYSDVPVLVSLGSGRATAVDTSGDNGCAILGNGSLRCWGLNDGGQLGLGYTSGPLRTPVTVPGISNVIAVAVGGGMVSFTQPNVCALTASGQVYCWGYGFGTSPQFQMTL